METKNNFRDPFADNMVTLLPRLWRLAVSLSRHKAVAEDLVQQTCERALERRLQFNPETRQDRWMFAIMASIWKNHLRSERVRKGFGQASLDELTDEKDAAEADASILRSELHRAVLELPVWQREAVLLVYVEDMSYRDAANILNLPLGTVMSRLAAAKTTLAARLNPAGNNAQSGRSYHGHQRP